MSGNRREILNTPAHREAMEAWAASCIARGRQEAEEVLVDLGSGVLWRMSRYDYARMRARERTRTRERYSRILRESFGRSYVR
jgi:hypothetical protein